MHQLKTKIYSCFIFFAFSLIALKLNSQQAIQLPYHDISKIKFEKEIGQELAMTYATASVSAVDFYSLQFKNGLIHKKSLPPGFVSKRPLLFFNLVNSSETPVSVFFYPGRYFNNVSIYQVTGEKTVEKIPDIFPDDPNSVSYRKITLNGKDSAAFYVLLEPIKTYTNTIRPQLVNETYINSFIRYEENNRPHVRFFSIIICGLLLMMIIFSLINFFQGANKEFFHYSAYAFFLGLMLFLKAAFGFDSSKFNFFVEGYFDFILLCAGHLFYLSFLQRFLDTGRNHKFVHRLCNVGIAGLILGIISFTLIHYFTNSYIPEYYIENITKILLLVVAVFFMFYAFNHRQNKIFRYLFWGNCCMFVFSSLSYLITIVRPRIPGLPEFFLSSINYYQTAILLELIFFLAGLSYKNKKQIIEQTRERERLKAENQMKEYEKELAVLKAQKDERSRISLDMHDELGSGMTAIRLMSELARTKLKENSPVEIDRISDSANDVLNKMNAIIWSMNSGNDTLDNLVSYIRVYSLEYFENTPINCKVNTPEQIETSELSGDKRRNIFLCVKETLNNALKHSAASNLIIDVETNHLLVIRIHDNGKGIDMQKLRQFGNGLKNIQNRMKTIGGTFSIENKNGTLTTITLPLAGAL